MKRLLWEHIRAYPKNPVSPKKPGFCRVIRIGSKSFGAPIPDILAHGGASCGRVSQTASPVAGWTHGKRGVAEGANVYTVLRRNHVEEEWACTWDWPDCPGRDSANHRSRLFRVDSESVRMDARSCAAGDPVAGSQQAAPGEQGQETPPALADHWDQVIRLRDDRQFFVALPVCNGSCGGRTRG